MDNLDNLDNRVMDGLSKSTRLSAQADKVSAHFSGRTPCNYVRIILFLAKGEI
jgi:hypothetical protein